MKSLILSMLIYVLFTINAYCGSNYYIIINDTAFNDFETFDYRINSLGGHVNHIFPPNEFICYLPEDNAEIILKYFDCNIEAYGLPSLNLSSKPGYISWQHLADNFSDTTDVQDFQMDSSDVSFKCGYHHIELPAV